MLEGLSLPWVACDTETSGLHPDDGARVACVALAHYDADTKDMWSIGLPFDQGVRDKIPNAQLDFDLFGGHGSEDVDPNLPREVWDELLRFLMVTPGVYHNGKYDVMMMRVGTRHWPGIDLLSKFKWCTMLVQRTLDPVDRAGLDAVAQRLGFGAKKGLDEVLGWLKVNHKRLGLPWEVAKKRYDLVPWHVIKDYVTTDAEMTAFLHAMQLQRLAEGGPDGGEDGSTMSPWDRIERDFWLMRSLYGMEERGIGFDVDQCVEAAEVLEERVADIEAKLPFPFAEAKRYFFGDLHLTPDRYTGQGKPSLDEEQLRAWAAEGIPWAREYHEASKVRRAISMWYRGYPEKASPEDRLRTTYRQGHVRSGRMSVERIQLQAIPKDDKYTDIRTGKRLPIYEGIPNIRSMLRAKPGYGLWNLDLSQAELRVAANYAQCQTMLDELKSPNPDIHGNTTERVLRTPRDAPDWKLKRDIGKRLTFSSIFQVGPQKFLDTLSKMADIFLTLEEATDMIYGWRAMYPEYGQAYRLAERKVLQRNYVRLLPNTPYEVRSWFGERDWPNSAWNRMVQGSLAFFFGMWLGEIERQWPGYAILTIHDSIVFEMPLDEGDQIAVEIAAWGRNTATELFGIEMLVDTDRYDK